FKCTHHHDIFSCPDNLMYYDEKFDEFGLIIHDGGQSYMLINFCPWCGRKLPESRRNQWFEELEQLGYDNPLEQQIPEKFKTNDWRSQD
ncbi:MAG: hypothetical protein FWE68_05095, partial [Defluviitaleaceae bacterium]|nr:hypothetical protein [Defluviitaleaceae bacterium]